MFKHYIQTALRHFRQHKLTTSINVACLSLGLLCFIVAWGTTVYLGRIDSYHANASQTYLLTSSNPKNGNMAIPTNPGLLAEHMRADFPQIEIVARAMPMQEVSIALDAANRIAIAVYADPELLRVFDLPLTAGDQRTALNEPHSALISKSFARTLFGSDQVIGRTFRLSGGKEVITVRGVVDAIPQPSLLTTESTILPLSLRFDVMLSMDLNPANRVAPLWTMNWFYTFVVLPRDGSLTSAELNRQLSGLVRRHVPDLSQTPTFIARPITHAAIIGYDMLAGTSKTGVSSVTIIRILGTLVLLVACLNYANLATAQAAGRVKELALRRAVGASRAQIATQHMIESLLLTCVAQVFALACTLALAASFGISTFVTLVKLFATMPQSWLFVAASVILVAVAASIYPALVLAGIRPAHGLRGARVRIGSRFVSTSLVGLQFASASFMLIAVFVTTAQNRIMKEAIWDNTTDPVLVIANDVRGAGVDWQVFKTELLRQPGVISAGALHRMPWDIGGNGDPVTTSPEATAARINSSYHFVDPGTFAALNLHLLAGRWFDAERAADVANYSPWQQSDVSASVDYNIVIDREMIERFGLANPQEAIDKTIYRPTSQSGAKPPQRLHIIGVVDNTVIRPMNLGSPSFYMMNSDVAVVPIIRISKHNVKEALAGIDKVWSTLAPEIPIKRRFADEQFESTHGFLKIVDVVFASLAGFASVIAVVGLIGMALHIIRRRTHEIGVRKTLGASVTQIVWLLLRSFSKPVVIANLAVWPIVYLAMRAYLSLFAVQSGLTLMPFILSLAITLFVAWLAVIVQATRASRMNPAMVLRNE